MNLLLSPHNDDEALFASYTLLRARPRVLVALDGGRKKHYPLPAARAAESAAAMAVLGCDFEHLGFACEDADWDAVEARLRLEDEPEHVWAPLPEVNGHRHHNRLAGLAVRLWPGRVSFYSTYTMVDDWPVRSRVGELVDAELGWDELKRRALGCYATQIASPGTSMHFDQPLDEYSMSSIRLNLASGPNPIAGFVNLDKSTGWMFEEGLEAYADGSVDAITVSHALMYVPLLAWGAVFAELARVLAPGGVLRVTEDAIGAPGSTRPVIRPHAMVATSQELVLGHMSAAGLNATPVEPGCTLFVDGTLIQQNYGSPPDVFHAEGVKA